MSAIGSTNRTTSNVRSSVAIGLNGTWRGQHNSVEIGRFAFRF
jgi:hypothetical protein